MLSAKERLTCSRSGDNVLARGGTNSLGCMAQSAFIKHSIAARAQEARLKGAGSEHGGSVGASEVGRDGCHSSALPVEFDHDRQAMFLRAILLQRHFQYS